MTRETRRTTVAALDSLRGLALGDAFGETWFGARRAGLDVPALLRDRVTPAAGHWPWTDDTALALALLAAAWPGGEVDQEAVAEGFGRAYLADDGRGYAAGMHELLPELAEEPGRWRVRSRELFGGQGSLGNGAAMRAAPLGALFGSDPRLAAERAALAAEVTHAHPEGVAGAVAVAVAAALAVTAPAGVAPAALLREVAGHTPASAVRDGLVRAAGLPADTGPAAAAAELGSGYRMRADDTVPFALWSAAHRLDELTEALWRTAEGLGDVDTTCAIAGGVVGARVGLAGVPVEWSRRAEPLPAWVAALRTP
ncbi:ADP-ribosylglycohydrolase family protein [Streptomyces sp. DSM 44915]|uniref:ADP-ribosylglycohydrolase family protein n=1 Tax=Streptomyces chisholmiae TaxID=3075540 RepID=A0ABU2JUQ6_9ACTN|nr:ADP-ribosylglycohydrolase family protein [Streptomyces sp. DSM 44915]MDT0268709.1 ADP-ribosylglycohydrolase family protein [Streptomyces sp. DSM 44915]